MKYRKLGHSGLQLSELSLGSWLTFGSLVDDQQSMRCLNRAFELGINFFDTADVYNYGGAEKMIGRFVKQIDREQVMVGTKVFFPMSDHIMDRGLSQRHILNSCKHSLLRLQTDYIDLYQCHRYDPTTPLEETCYAMHSLIEKGMILHWGVSQWSAVQILNALRVCERHNWHKPIANQPIYNMLNRSLEVDVMEVCEDEGLGIVVYSPLSQGILTGKYTKDHIPEDSRAANDESTHFFSHKRLTERNFERIDALKTVAADLGCTLPQLALAWCLRKSPVTSVIIGASRIEQIDENIKAVEVELTDELLTHIEKLLDNAPVDLYTGHRIGHGS